MTDLATQLRLSMFAALVPFPAVVYGAGYDIAVMLLAFVLLTLSLGVSWCDRRASR